MLRPLIVALCLLSALLLAGLQVVAAQTGSPIIQLAQTSDGQFWILAEGQRHRIALSRIDDAAIMQLPEGEPWGPGAGISGPAPAPPATPTWHQVARWEGRSDKRTEPFTVSGAQWRIVYTTRSDRPTERYPNGQVCIEIRTMEARLVDNGCYTQSDTSYLYGKPGTFYLDITSSDPWTVTVEDLS